LPDAFFYGILRIRYTAIRSRVYGAFVRTGHGRIAGKFNFENATVANEHDYQYDVDVVVFVSNAEPKPKALDTSASTPV
jgi:hypothetical protein